MQSLDEWTATAAERGPSLAYYLQMCSMTDVDDPELVRLVDAGAPASKVKRLILEGADVNATSNWGYTALYTAVLERYARGVVVDYCMGTGVCGEVALALGHSFVGVELHADRYADARRRLAHDLDALH